MCRFHVLLFFIVVTVSSFHFVFSLELDLLQFDTLIKVLLIILVVVVRPDEVKEDRKKTWRTRNLGFAKHRHSSVLKPASRFVLHTSAIIHAAMETLDISKY